MNEQERAELLDLLDTVVEWAHEGIAYERYWREYRFSEEDRERESDRVKRFEERIRALIGQEDSDG